MLLLHFLLPLLWDLLEHFDLNFLHHLPHLLDEDYYLHMGKGVYFHQDSLVVD
jgi:hypothetical protein